MHQKIPQNKDDNPKTKGDKLEDYVARTLDMQKTSGSGNQKDDADLKDEIMLVECKVKCNNRGISITHDQAVKIARQAAKWSRDWALVSMNADGNIYATLPYEFFREIYEVYKDKLKQKINDDRRKGFVPSRQEEPPK